MSYIKYEYAIIDSSYREAFVKLETKAVQDVARAFVSNVDRIQSLVKLAPASIKSSISLAISVAHATWLRTGKPLSNKGYEGPEGMERLYEEIRIVFDDYINQTGLDIGATEDDWGWANNILNRLIDKKFNHLEVGLEAVLSGVILGTWTAFETLSGDLWEEALNAQPDPLAKLLGGKNKPSEIKDIQKSSERISAIENFSKIDISIIHKLDYNLTNKMGALLRGKFSFVSLAGIKEAYWSAFSGNSSHIYSILEGREFHWLSQVRNLLIHKSGLIDKPFFDKMEAARKTSKHFSDIEIGSNLGINGEMVRDLTSPVIDRSVQLILKVDEWITNSKKEKQ